MLDSQEFLAKLAQWNQVKSQLADVAPLAALEMKLRKELFGMAFPAPVEGTNTADIPNGWKVKGIYKIERKVDQAALPAVKEMLTGVQVNADTLIRMTPEVEIKVYRTLSDANRAIFDQALIIKPQSPQFELIPPPQVKEPT